MKGFFRRIGNAMAKWSYGRNGQDELNFVLTVLALVFLLLSYIPFFYTKIMFSVLAILTVTWSIFRCFSKNLPRRRRELERYYKIKNAPRRARTLRKNKKRDKKTHLYFKCPQCRSVLRVPRGKGDITVTCPKCQRRTDKRT